MATPDREALLAALEWQLELGADEAIADAPIDRYALFAAEAEAARAPARPMAALARPMAALARRAPLRPAPHLPAPPPLALLLPAARLPARDPATPIRRPKRRPRQRPQAAWRICAPHSPPSSIAS